MIRTDILERKIKTANDLHSIVKTMKGLAAVSINQYDHAVEAISDYFSTIEDGLQIVLRDHPQLTSFFQAEQSKGNTKQIAIVFGAGQPMCGAFNEVMANYYSQQTESLSKRDLKLVVIGQRVAGNLDHYGWSVDHLFDMPTTLEQINTTVHQLLLAIQEWYSAEEYDKACLYYNRPEQNASYKPGMEQLLPIDTDWLQQLIRREWEGTSIPTFSMEAPALVSALTKELLFVSIYKGFAESLSAENNSRLAAMQVAEKKISEMIDDLTKAYRNQRQINITEEILDIMASFEVSQTEEKDRSQLK